MDQSSNSPQQSMIQFDRHLHILPSEILNLWEDDTTRPSSSPSNMRRKKSIQKKLSRAAQSMSAFLIPITTALPMNLSLDTRDCNASPVYRAQSLSGTRYYQWHEEGEVQTHEEYVPPEKEGIRQTLSRRWSQTWRGSWGSRRSFISTATSTPETGMSEEWDGVVTEKVKRVSRIRDWSLELDEDDVYERPVYQEKPKETRIIWAEEECDIGQHWRFISDTD